MELYAQETYRAFRVGKLLYVNVMSARARRAFKFLIACKAIAELSEGAPTLRRTAKHLAIDVDFNSWHETEREDVLLLARDPRVQEDGPTQR